MKRKSVAKHIAILALSALVLAGCGASDAPATGELAQTTAVVESQSAPVESAEDPAQDAKETAAPSESVESSKPAEESSAPQTPSEEKDSKPGEAAKPSEEKAESASQSQAPEVSSQAQAESKAAEEAKRAEEEKAAEESRQAEEAKKAEEERLAAEKAAEEERARQEAEEQTRKEAEETANTQCPHTGNRVYYGNQIKVWEEVIAGGCKITYELTEETCADCQQPLGFVERIGQEVHHGIIIESGISATCTTDGRGGISSCDCGKTYTDYTSNIYPATGHSMETWCTGELSEDGTKVKYIIGCVYCDYVESEWWE